MALPPNLLTLIGNEVLIMATMTLANGTTVELTFEELAQLFTVAAATASSTATEVKPKPAKREAKTEAKPKREAKAAKPKAEAKTEAKPEAKPKPKAAKRGHDAVLDSKRVARMTGTAIERAKSQGFECKARKQGAWMWIYPTNGTGRTPEFKALKLAKGWKYSPKRGAFYRDFKEC